MYPLSRSSTNSLVSGSENDHATRNVRAYTTRSTDSLYPSRCLVLSSISSFMMDPNGLAGHYDQLMARASTRANMINVVRFDEPESHLTRTVVSSHETQKRKSKDSEKEMVRDRADKTKNTRKRHSPLHANSAFASTPRNCTLYASLKAPKSSVTSTARPVPEGAAHVSASGYTRTAQVSATPHGSTTQMDASLPSGSGVSFFLDGWYT